jgi:hypothetical protein
MMKTEKHRDGKAEKSNTPIACSNASIRHLHEPGNHMHAGGLLGRTHTSSLRPALVMSAQATISSSINHRVSILYSTTTRLAKHINDFQRQYYRPRPGLHRLEVRRRQDSTPHSLTAQSTTRPCLIPSKITCLPGKEPSSRDIQYFWQPSS